MKHKKITVYTRSYCPYCVFAVKYFKDNNLDFEEIDVSHNPKLRATISKDNGHFRTLPMIIIGTTFVGGYDDLMLLQRQGKLRALLDI